MASLEQIQLLLSELGPATDEVLEIQQQGDDSWDVFYDEATAVGIEVMEGQDKLMLSIELGSPPEEHRNATFQWLLIHNYAWRSTGGVKMALDAPNGSIQMMFELNSVDLDLITLQNVLLHFCEKARAWREVIAEGIREDDTIDFSEMDITHAIRV